ncbi:phospholipase D delta-like isoform X2 [Macadamia integrifolia]|nr:phospholipase D delta-like isoform X2 [Macadamia integrifolia]
METNYSDLIYLHGDLQLKIIEACSLPNMDLFSEHLRRCFAACCTCRVSPANGNRKHKPHRQIMTSDPYVTVIVGGVKVASTRVIPNSENPFWNQKFYIPLAHPVTHVEFQVKDNDLLGAQLIGIVLVPAHIIFSGNFIQGWFKVIGPYGKPPKPDSALRLEMQFTPVESNPLYQQGIAADPQHLGVRNTYFPVRKGCSVTLYEDAHVRERELPDIELENGMVFQHEKCWEDICHAILEAHHLVYIVGWSIYHKVRLVREPTRPLPNGGDLTLGELLKYKSREGVRVLLLVWDDQTSHNKFFIETDLVIGSTIGSGRVRFGLYLLDDDSSLVSGQALQTSSASPLMSELLQWHRQLRHPLLGDFS